jgi:hypothetical protein
MLSPADLIHLPFTPDLTQAGVAYLCRSLCLQHIPAPHSDFIKLRRVVSETAVRLAFQRHLQKLEVPFLLRQHDPFTQPDSYDISIGGRRCKIHLTDIHQKDLIRSIQHDRERLLSAQALAPLPDQGLPAYTGDELFIFAFLTGLVTPYLRDIRRAQAANQPVDLIHLMPAAWNQPRPGRSLGELVVKSEPAEPVWVEFGGLGSGRTCLREEAPLPARQRFSLESTFHNLAYLRLKKLPEGRLGVYSPALNSTHIVQPENWSNVWVYGIGLYFAGFTSAGEYFKNAGCLPAGSPTLASHRTATPQLAVPLRELQPLENLFSRAQLWQKTNS